MKKRIQVKTEKPQFTVITNLTYAQHDSWFGHTMQDLKMDLIYPEDSSRTYPCIVWICGGAWLQLDKSAHLAYLSELSRKGFVVASVQYRTSNETPLPGQIQDVKAGILQISAVSPTIIRSSAPLRRNPFSWGKMCCAIRRKP